LAEPHEPFWSRFNYYGLTKNNITSMAFKRNNEIKVNNIVKQTKRTRSASFFFFSYAL